MIYWPTRAPNSLCDKVQCMGPAKSHRERAKCAELSRTPGNLPSVLPSTGHLDFGPQLEAKSGLFGNMGRGGQ